MAEAPNATFYVTVFNTGSYVNRILLNIYYPHTLAHWPGHQADPQPVKALSGTLIFGLGLGQILQVGLDQVSQLVQDLSPLLGAALRPRWEGVFSCCHRRLHLHVPQIWRCYSESLVWCCARARLHSRLFYFDAVLCISQADLDLTNAC